MNFHEAWIYLCEHKIFKNYFQSCLYIDVVKVNPKTREIDDDKTKNTLTEVWLETGPWMMPEDFPPEHRWQTPKHGEPSHDYELDCGGETFEEAIIKMAKLVKEKYDKKKEEN